MQNGRFVEALMANGFFRSRLRTLAQDRYIQHWEKLLFGLGDSVSKSRRKHH